MAENLGAQGLLCPTCRVDLVMSERQGIEIDYCPQCRGVWLDRGELDKIIERSVGNEAARQSTVARPAPREEYRGHGGDRDEHGYGHKRGHSGRRKSFLSELFD